MSHKVPALEETLKSLFKFKRTVQSLRLKWSIVETCEATRTLASGHSYRSLLPLFNITFLSLDKMLFQAPI